VLPNYATRAKGRGARMITARIVAAICGVPHPLVGQHEGVD
jgi:hypothetical protein